MSSSKKKREEDIEALTWLRDYLYDRSWRAMTIDLKCQQEKLPKYLKGHQDRIRQDLKIIEGFVK